MRVMVFKRQEVRINGVLYKIEAGVQELEPHVAELLLNLGLAEKVEEKRDDNRRRSQRVSKAG